MSKRKTTEILTKDEAIAYVACVNEKVNTMIDTLKNPEDYDVSDLFLDISKAYSDIFIKKPSVLSTNVSDSVVKLNFKVKKVREEYTPLLLMINKKDLAKLLGNAKGAGRPRLKNPMNPIIFLLKEIQQECPNILGRIRSFDENAPRDFW